MQLTLGRDEHVRFAQQKITDHLTTWRTYLMTKVQVYIIICWAASFNNQGVVGGKNITWLKTIIIPNNHYLQLNIINLPIKFNQVRNKFLYI